MADSSANPPYPDSLLEEIHADQNTNTGIENKKLIMWLFLASDCMFFGTLISTHLIYRKLYPFGHPSEGKVNITGTFDIELTSFSTFILLMSSFLMALAVSAMHKGALQSFRRYTLGVIVFGLIFLGGQVYEFQHFFHGQGWYEWKAESKAGQVLIGNEQNKLLVHDVADPKGAKEGFLHEHLGLELIKFEPKEGATFNKEQPTLPLTFNYEVELPDSVGNDPETFYGEYIYHPGNPHASQIVVLSDIPPPPVSEEKKDDAKKDEGEKAEATSAKDEETAQNSEEKSSEEEKSAASEDAASTKTAQSGEEDAKAEEQTDGEKTASKEAEDQPVNAEAPGTPASQIPETEGEPIENLTADADADGAKQEAHGEEAHEAAPMPTSMAGMKAAAKDAFKHSNFGFELQDFKSVKTVPALDMRTSVFGSTFYVMTGTHGTHVALGVLWLFSLLMYSYSGRLTPKNAIDVEIAGLYWHFVDIVWIVIFTAVYLVEYI